MTPELRARLLAYANELVDQKVEAMKFISGHRATVTGNMVSLDVAQPAPQREEEDLYVRVWASVTYTQTAADGAEPYLYPTKVVSLPIFPVFTLKPPESQEAARQAQLEQMEYYLENASEYTSPSSLVFLNSSAPLVLALNGSTWSQYQFPPYYPVYPGSYFLDSDFIAPFRVGGPSEVPGPQIGDPPVQTVEAIATVTLYLRSHSEDSLDNFEAGGEAETAKLTVRQVGLDTNGYPLVQLQDEIVGFFGKTFIFNAISTLSSKPIAETVSLVGFEPR